MHIIRGARTPVMEFKRIRNGTVFTCNDATYIKGNDIYATNLETGEVLQPNKGNSNDWSECVVHNRSLLKLS